MNRKAALIAGAVTALVLAATLVPDTGGDPARHLLDRARSATTIEDRLLDTLRAYRTRDRLDTRSDLRGLARELRFADRFVPDHATTNPSGTRIAHHDEDGNLSGIVDVGGPGAIELPLRGGRHAAWLGDDRIATVRDGRVLVHDQAGQLLREAVADPDTLVGDWSGRFLAFTTPAGRPRVIGLDGSDVTLPTTATLLGVLPSGEAILADRTDKFAMSTTGTRDLPDDLPVDPTRSRPTITKCDHSGLTRFDTTTGARLGSVPGQPCTTGAFTEDGTEWATVEGTALALGDTATGTVTRRVEIPDQAGLISVEPEPGGHRVVLDDHGTALVLRIPPPDGLDRAFADAHRAAVTPDGALVVLLWRDGRIEVWDRGTRRRLNATTTRFPAGDRVEFALSPDSRALAARTVDHVGLWTLPGLAPTTVDAVGTPAFLDDTRLVVSGEDTTVWERGTRLGPPIHATAPYAAADGDDLVLVTAAGSARTFKIGDGSGGAGFEVGRTTAVALADGTLAVADDHTVRIHDLRTGEQERRTTLPDDTVVSGLVSADDEVTITLDGTLDVSWRWNVLWGLPALIGRGTESLEDVPGPAVPGYAVEGVGVESADPAVWHDALCGVVHRSGLADRPHDLPAGAFADEVC
ncbi:hypothetical protein GCM10022243_07520 [Saccharothrix violaceirubra]|uniref:WD40 repeat protein n=1 Tax=Saccharothrix violaceirubra TaxID=413306 RepID=A0A7W7T0T0_9PSEU|nr:WD40 repeat domain-containing protein [Saccharothrix violaceirubra]MBB4963165.1 hypothetical protein [Saccharothrix violaceirubra]